MNRGLPAPRKGGSASRCFLSSCTLRVSNERAVRVNEIVGRIYGRPAGDGRNGVGARVTSKRANDVSSGRAVRLVVARGELELRSPAVDPWKLANVCRFQRRCEIGCGDALCRLL